MKTAYKMPARAGEILIKLREALITEPPDLIVTNKDTELIERIELLLGEFQPLFRFFFILGIYFFDKATFLFGYGLRRFIHMDLVRRENYAQYWLTGRFTVCRDIISGMRGLVMLAYFSHHDVWRYIDYDPAGHAQRKISMREDLMRRGEVSSPAILGNANTGGVTPPLQKT